MAAIPPTAGVTIVSVIEMGRMKTGRTAAPDGAKSRSRRARAPIAGPAGRPPILHNAPSRFTLDNRARTVAHADAWPQRTGGNVV
jgi:hypothetical protein